MPHSLRLLAVFGVASLSAVATGCLVAQASGVPASVWVRNPVSWGVGAAIALLLQHFGGRRVSWAFLAAAPLGLLCSLAGAGQLGVHRWLEFGPLSVNAAQVLLPPAIVACAEPGRAKAWVAAACMALLIAQPDASQATAFGGALLVLLGSADLQKLPRLGLMTAVVVAVGMSWWRADPLGPVPEVEEIMRLAWALSPLAWAVAWAALLAAAASFVLVPPAARGGGRRPLAAYALLSALTPLLGAYPVPLVGMAMSPIVGLWLGAGMAAAQARRATGLSASTQAAAAG